MLDVAKLSVAWHFKGQESVLSLSDFNFGNIVPLVFSVPKLNTKTSNTDLWSYFFIYLKNGLRISSNIASVTVSVE